MNRPLCFVLLSFGEKTDAAGAKINFDALYRDLIIPAIEKAELEPVRAKEDRTGGITHKSILEQLILAEYALVDLTTADGNVMCGVGMRCALRPGTTLVIFSEASGVTFDLGSLRALPYALSADGFLKDAQGAKAALALQLREVRESASTSSIYELVENYPEIAHTKTDVFRERVQYSPERKAQLAAARKKGIEALRAIEAELGNIEDCESGVVIDLLLSYRAVQAWKEMTDLVKKMSGPLASTVMVQEQLGLALNRIGKGEQAEEVLQQLLSNRGPSSETYSILGRVYKDRWEEAQKRSDDLRAKGLLEQAIEAYRRGFEADWRDAFPGINTVTLMELQEPPDPRREQLLPVVSYAVERRIADAKFDYWDQASRVELAVLSKDKDKALAALSEALAVVREPWEPETTARNLRLIREARERRNETVSWAKEVEDALNQRSSQSLRR